MQARTEASGGQPKISFVGVRKLYPGKGGSDGTLALESFNFDFAPAEIVSIVGPTGCGKSTAMNVLAGFEQASSGTVSVDGMPVTAPGSDRGVVFQQPSLFPWLSVLSNVVLGVKCRGGSPQEYEPRAMRLLEEVGLKGFERHYPYQLSNSVDAGIAWSPYSVMLDAEGYKVVSWDSEYTPPGGLCPRTTAARPAYLKTHPEIGVKLLEVDAMASEAVAKNPQVAIDALVKRLSLAPAVAKATVERVYMQRPSYAQQVEANSPYSMTSKDGGLAGKYLQATQVLYETKSIPEPVPLNVIQEAIDPTDLKKYLDASKAKK